MGIDGTSLKKGLSSRGFLNQNFRLEIVFFFFNLFPNKSQNSKIAHSFIVKYEFAKFRRNRGHGQKQVNFKGNSFEKCYVFRTIFTHCQKQVNFESLLKRAKRIQDISIIHHDDKLIYREILL